MEIINVLSLFDGISCGRLALEKANIKVDTYYASEINKHAIRVTQSNFPNTVQLGDVTNITDGMINKLNKIDLLIAGSPCTGFSVAGKKLNFEDPQSKLFFEFVRILELLKKSNPNLKFLLENVKMKREWQEIITDYLKVEPVLINSNSVSAQNRERLYWTNISFDNLIEDKQICLSDIIEKEIDDNLIVPTEKIKHPTFKRKYLQWDTKGKGHASQDQRAYYLEGKHGTLPSTGGGSKSKVVLDKENLVVKKLSCVEVERLQTLPDDYTYGLSNAKRHEVIGNGWTVDVIAHIFKGLNE